MRKEETTLKVTCRPLMHAELCKALSIRIKVFVEEQQVPLEEERDAYDDTALHFGAFVGDKMVGTGRVVFAISNLFKLIFTDIIEF